jgi:hypothetical protein
MQKGQFTENGGHPRIDLPDFRMFFVRLPSPWGTGLPFIMP